MTGTDAAIELATEADVANITACAKAAYAMYVERIGREPAPMVADFADAVARGHVYVLANAQSLFGFVVFYPREDHLHLENVAVLPECKGLGMGSRLLRFVEEEARRRGLNAVELYTNAQMTENLALYPQIGYRETARRIEDGFSRVYFRKEL